MSIKRIMFPLFVIVLVFVGLKFIHPAILFIFEQQSLKETKLADLVAVEKTATNIGSLVDSRKTLLESENGETIMLYLPEKTDQDRVVDVLNYLGLRTGAVIGSISFDKGSSASPISSIADQPVDASGLPIAVAPSQPIPPSFSATIEASGGYESLRSFMERIASMNRLQHIDSFSISKQEKSASADEAQVSTDILSMKLELSFPYLPTASYEGAHLLPVFESGAIDVASIAGLMSSRESIPVLSDPELSGRRADPFKF